MNLFLITAYCSFGHLHMWLWVSGSFPHARHTSHASLPALKRALHVHTPFMCIALNCHLCHCVSCLELIRCGGAALSIPFAASSLRSFLVIILSLASLRASLKSCLNFLSSPLMREILLLSFRHIVKASSHSASILCRHLEMFATRRVCCVSSHCLGSGPHAFLHFSLHCSCLSSTVPGHRYRLIARSLHWVNRMPPDQGGQQYLFASPSLVFPHRPGDCRSQRGTSLFPCISTFNCVMPVNITKCSLFKGEDTLDRANSVGRGRRLCSSLILDLTIPLLPL